MTKNENRLKRYIQKLDLIFKKEKFISPFILCSDLLIADDDVYVIEFNTGLKKCDCETILNYVQIDWLELFFDCANSMMNDISFKEQKTPITTIVMTSKGYPLKVRKNVIINNLENIKKMFDNIQVYFSNIIIKDGCFFSDGGRILSISSEDKSVIYRAMSHIGFEEKVFKLDVEVKND